MARPEWIEVGRVSRPHGINGEVRVVPDSDNPARFGQGAVVHGRPGRGPLAGAITSRRVALSIETVRGDAAFPIVAFTEIEDRDAAEGIRGFILEIPGDELPVLGADEFYPFDLEGLTVKDSKGSVVGRVKEVIDSPAHPLLVVQVRPGEEILVPFVLAAVPTVCLAEEYLVVERSFFERPVGGS